MITSMLTSKAQTTIPQAVRNALGLREGDEIAYAIEADRVVLTRVLRETADDDPKTADDDPVRCFSVWDGSADTGAYAKL